MTAPQWTPPDWCVVERDGARHIAPAWDRRVVVAVLPASPSPRVAADAELLASAPALYEALEDLIGWPSFAPPALVEAGRDALARARGRQEYDE